MGGVLGPASLGAGFAGGGRKLTVTGLSMPL
jgi:hypothetical protein